MYNISLHINALIWFITRLRCMKWKWCVNASFLWQKLKYISWTSTVHIMCIASLMGHTTLNTYIQIKISNDRSAKFPCPIFNSLFCHSLRNIRVRIKHIAIGKCDQFFNYRDANVANSTKFAIPNFVRNISFLLFFFQVVTFSVLSRHFLRNTQQKHHNSLLVTSND